MGNQIMPSSPPKDPIIALVLSALLGGGAGQIYLGQTVKGIVLIVATVVSCGILGIIAVPLGAIDAYLIAKKLQEGNPVDDWEFFWANKNKQLNS